MTKILLCDDHPVVANGLREILNELEDCQVVGTVSTARQVEHSILSLCPDLLFLDLNMGGENMAEKIADLKKIRPSLKVVVFTSYNLPSLVSRVFELGAEAYLLKSSSQADILEAVSAARKGKRHIGESVRMLLSERGRWLGQKPLPEDDFSAVLVLTKREREIFNLIVEGQTEQEIGQRLHLSIHTVHTHRKSLMKKLQLHNSADFVRFANRRCP